MIGRDDQTLGPLYPLSVLVTFIGMIAAGRLTRMPAGTRPDGRVRGRTPKGGPWDEAGVARGLVLAVAGFGLSLAGLVAANRPGRVGSGLAGLGIVCGLAVLVIAVAVLSGAVTWLSTTVDEAGRLHEWVRRQWPWLPHG